jgi:hypothetical protein
MQTGNPNSIQLLQRSLSCNAGFSLVQVLVSTAIGGLLVALIAQMAGSSARNVSESSGRMISAEQVHELRESLVRDLSRVPHPSLVGQASFQLSSGGSLNLVLPAAQNTTPISYQWNAPTQTLERLTSTQTEVIAVGVQELKWSALLSAADRGGLAEWSSTTELPAALLCQVRIGASAESAAPGRDYEFIVPVGGTAP